MKVYIVWISKRLAYDWKSHNSQIVTENIAEADVIWLQSYYEYDKIPNKYAYGSCKKKIITFDM